MRKESLPCALPIHRREYARKPFRLRFSGIALGAVGAKGASLTSDGPWVCDQDYPQNTGVDDISTVLDNANRCDLPDDAGEPGVASDIAQLHEPRPPLGGCTRGRTCEAWRNDLGDIEPR